jgi:homoaconitase/3-isopropylmalate dehydratase large subunit
VHEVTSPQAFEGLRMSKRKVRAPEKTLAVVDHNIATTADRNEGIKDEESRIQVETMAKNAKDFGIEYYDERDIRQGIVHVIGPRAGLHAARHHHRLRRQPHLHAWRLRRAGARHRHRPRWSTCWPPRH